MKKMWIGLLAISLQGGVVQANQEGAKLNETLAVVTFVSGKAFYVRDQKTRPLTPRTFLYQNDRVYTENGKADIQVGPHAILRLSPASTLDMADLFEQGDSRRIRMDLHSGSIYAKIVKKLDKDSSFTIKSPTLVASVRGTEFVVAEERELSDPKKKLEDSDIPPGVFVNEGEVAVQKIESQDLPPEKRPIGQVEAAIIVQQGEQVLSKTQTLQKQILDDFMKRKMEIFAKLDVMKEKNYEMMKKQRERDYENLQKIRQKQQDNLERIKGK